MMREAPCREVGGTLAPRVQLCGRFVVRLGDARVEGALPGRQGRLALAYLVLHRRRPVARDELAEALWHGGSPGDPAGALAAVLSKLRRVLGTETLAGRSLIELRLPTDTLVDVEAALEAIHRAEAAVQRGDYADAWAPARVALQRRRGSCCLATRRPGSTRGSGSSTRCCCARTRPSPRSGSGSVAARWTRRCGPVARWCGSRRCVRAVRAS